MFKYLCPIYFNVLSPNSTLPALWKFFYFRSYVTNFVKGVAGKHVKQLQTPICPDATRWVVHEQACENICKGFTQILSDLLCVLMKERNLML